MKPISYFRKSIIAATAMVVVFADAAQGASALVINEVMYDPAGTDTGKEWIELLNNGSSAVSLAGWQLNAASGNYYTFPDISLQPGNFVVIRWRSDGADSPAELFTGSSSFDNNMGNTSGFVALFNSSSHTKDTIIDYAEYGAAGQTWESTASSAAIWIRGTFVADAGEGYSIGLASDGSDTNAPSDWIVLTNPTPGASNTSPPLPTPTPAPSPAPSISPSTDSSPSPQATSGSTASPLATPEPTPTPVPSLSPSPTPSAITAPAPAPTPSPTPIALPYVHINEFYPNTANADVEEEWIELWNEGGTSAGISGWKIDDADGGSQPYTIPQGTAILPGGYKVFTRPVTAIALNNDADAVRLLTPGGQVYESVSYEKPPQGASSNRLSNGSYVWSWTQTPGRANVVSGSETTSQKTPTPPPSGGSISISSPTPFISANATATEASVSPLIAKTGYLPAPSPDNRRHSSETSSDSDSSPSSIVPEILTANLSDAVPPPEPYRSFFSRYALVLALFGAAAGALGLVRWRRSRMG